MKTKAKLLLFLGVLVVGIIGYRYVMTPTDYRHDMGAYVDFAKFKEGRPCAEVKFMCLPESQDKSWQSMPTKDHIENFKLTSEVMERYRYIVNAYQFDAKTRKEKGMLLRDLDKDLHKRVEAKQFLIKMEKSLEKEFPGFWRETPKKVRYRWIRRAMAKSKKLGYGEGEISRNKQIIELCARIGLDFDLDPKWRAITQFIINTNRGHRSFASIACDYLDFTLFNKNTDRYGRPITDWSLRTALQYLPYPKRPVPKLSDIK
jgi:hypothetical protein